VAALSGLIADDVTWHAGHFAWEDRADEYAALITSWWGDGYATIGR
jgi:hypothetical protein